jgi:hypothetical protein
MKNQFACSFFIGKVQVIEEIRSISADCLPSRI